MSKEDLLKLSRRERQIMEVLYGRGSATAREINDAIDDPPSHSAVRALIRVLEEKGHVRHVKDGRRNVYQSVRSRARAKKSVLRRVVDTFFEGSVEAAVATLVSSADRKLSAEELGRISAIVDGAAKEVKGAKK